MSVVKRMDNCCASRTIYIPIGSDYTINMRWMSKFIVGQPIQLYGYKFYCSFNFDSDVNKILYQSDGEDIATIPDMGIIRITIPKESTKTLSCYDSGIYTIGYFDSDNCIDIMRGRWNTITQLYNRPIITDDDDDDSCGGCTIDWGY